MLWLNFELALLCISMPTLLFLWWNSEPTLLSISSLVTTNYFMSLQPKTIRGVAGGRGDGLLYVGGTKQSHYCNSLTLPLIISAGKLRKSKWTSFYIGSGKVPMATEKIHGGLVLCWGQSYHGNRDNLLIWATNKIQRWKWPCYLCCSEIHPKELLWLFWKQTWLWSHFSTLS